ncbi:unnamed protein product [Trichogramma brassicae]|uniref:Uncharacterized protein n=1 Tax=Trichogramma brassicae TaxID=86971 RepID=A0A6H5I6Y4_9HYME|nr:unnamed protein product [Trichogramma brassicae]
MTHNGLSEKHILKRIRNTFVRGSSGYGEQADRSDAGSEKRELKRAPATAAEDRCCARRSGGSSELFSLGKPRESIMCVTSVYVHTIARRLYVCGRRVFKIYTDTQVRPSSSECLSAMNHEQQRQLLLQCLVRAVSSPTRRIVRRGSSSGGGSSSSSSYSAGRAHARVARKSFTRGKTICLWGEPSARIAHGGLSTKSLLIYCVHVVAAAAAAATSRREKLNYSRALYTLCLRVTPSAPRVRTIFFCRCSSNILLPISSRACKLRIRSRPGFTRSEHHVTLVTNQVEILYFWTISSRKSTGFYPFRAPRHASHKPGGNLVLLDDFLEEVDRVLPVQSTQFNGPHIVHECTRLNSEFL